jgi:hypothetical protein
MHNNGDNRGKGRSGTHLFAGTNGSDGAGVLKGHRIEIRD